MDSTEQPLLTTGPVTYVAGPMTGYPDFNRAAFYFLTKKLRDCGHQVLCPAEVAENTDTHPWADCLRVDIRLLLQCQRVVLLPGWSRSKGATLEVLVAAALGMEIMEYRAPELDKLYLDALDYAWLFIRARLQVSA